MTVNRDITEAGGKAMVVFKKDAKRNDFEVIDQTGRTHGFIWPYEKHWICRIGERPAEKFDTYEMAAIKAKLLVTEALNHKDEAR